MPYVSFKFFLNDYVDPSIFNKIGDIETISSILDTVRNTKHKIS